ncbi:MAG: outer membrane lipoprotein-sorting protein [Bdellovibrionota bacterium]|nr:outer membrane lipoprotein-sorting protein [Bdellovibrionota bacterium]
MIFIISTIKKFNFHRLLFICFSLFTFFNLFNSSLSKGEELKAESPTPKEIMKKVFNRNEGKSSYVSNILLSCQFEVVKQKNKSKKKCSSPPRIKEFKSIAIEIKKDKIDAKSLSLIKKPASEKGLGFMQVDYIEEGKSSDQWMFLPALKKTKRVVGDEDGPKTGSFFGSEISYEDIEKHHENDFNYKLVKEDKVKNTPTWVIEMTPNAKKAKTRSYGKSISWISKNSYIVLKTENYDKRGFLLKTFKQSKVEKINGVWIAKRMIVINHQKSRMSMLKLKSVLINPKFSEDLISLRALKDETFLESELQKIHGQK